MSHFCVDKLSGVDKRVLFLIGQSPIQLELVAFNDVKQLVCLYAFLSLMSFDTYNNTEYHIY